MLEKVSPIVCKLKNYFSNNALYQRTCQKLNNETITRTCFLLCSSIFYTYSMLLQGNFNDLKVVLGFSKEMVFCKEVVVNILILHSFPGLREVDLQTT